MPSLTLLFLAKALAYILAFGFADGFNGGQFGWNKLAHDHGGPLHGRGIYYVLAPLLALCWALDGVPALCLGAAWAVYRAAFGFSAGTITGRDRGATIARHTIIWALGAGIALWFRLPLITLAPFGLYTFAAVVLAKWDGDKALDSERPEDINSTVEPTRGAVFGLALALSMALAQAH